MGRKLGVSQGNKLSAYLNKTERAEKVRKKRKKTSAWGHFSIEKDGTQTRYDL